MRAGHRQGGGVGGCSSGVVRENNIVGLELFGCRRTHTRTLFKYSLGEPLEAKFLKEYLVELTSKGIEAKLLKEHAEVIYVPGT